MVAKYEFYWRLDPNVKFHCDLDYESVVATRSACDRHPVLTPARPTPAAHSCS